MKWRRLTPAISILLYTMLSLKLKEQELLLIEQLGGYKL